MLEKEFVVVAIHGEGDRSIVNALQQHRNKEEAMRLMRQGVSDLPEALTAEPDESPDVVVVLRDPHHNFRLEWPVETWEEVEHWKELAGWDADKRHWQHGATVKVAIGA
jgi:hypothetical protein